MTARLAASPRARRPRRARPLLRGKGSSPTSPDSSASTGPTARPSASARSCATRCSPTTTGTRSCRTPTRAPSPPPRPTSRPCATGRSTRPSATSPPRPRATRSTPTASSSASASRYKQDGRRRAAPRADLPGEPGGRRGDGPGRRAPVGQRQGGGRPPPHGRDQHRLRCRAGGRHRRPRLARPAGSEQRRHPHEAPGHDPHRLADGGARRRRGRGSATSTSATSSSPRWTALNTAFTQVRDAGATELVLDLRYNGGGLVSVAQHLAGLIAGDPLVGQVFVQFTHNDKQSSRNTAYRFEAKPQALAATRLVVIATRGSASASEAVINGLRPYMDVKVVGDTTYGKPVGQYGFDFCDEGALPGGVPRHERARGGGLLRRDPGRLRRRGRRRPRAGEPPGGVARRGPLRR